MGHIFESKDQTIWSPSRDVALCFLAQIHHLEDRLEMHSGLSETMSDVIEIDYVVLHSFIVQIGKWANFSNSSICLLLRGVVVHLLALLSSAAPLPDSILALYSSEWTDEARLTARRAMVLPHLNLPPNRPTNDS
jgi:hypothetical protein